MFPKTMKYVIILLFAGVILQMNEAYAQFPGGLKRLQGMGSSFRGGGGGGKGSSDSLSFEKRNFADDSVNVRFRYLDTARYSGFDSTIDDYYKRVAMKPEFVHIGHNGNAIRPILFTPLRGPGWDAGFHAFDPYAFTIENTRFMNTTKPFTQLGFLVGSKAEQLVNLTHTQNVQPDWNFVLQYRLLNSPGTFNSQNTNHNNLRFNTDYTSKDKRYHLFLIMMSNVLQSSENGGIVDDSYLVNPNGAYNDRFNIPTNLASAAYSSRNFFNVKLHTGNRYSDKQFLLRQQYDFGKKDSVVTDSSVIRFFLPTFRVEHTIHKMKYDYLFMDEQATNGTDFYKQHYGLTSIPSEIRYEQKWSVLKNDFSILQFPDPKNPLQYFKAGLSYANYTSDTGLLINRFFNVMAHGEYRNRTRNKKWDMLLYGEMYPAGRDAGNYQLQAHLQTDLGKKLGMLEIGFQNINRTPSYLYNYTSLFPVKRNAGLNDENVTAISGSLYIAPIKSRLSIDYYLISNYTYLSDFVTVSQQAALFNFARIGVNKVFALGRKWRWHMDVYAQTATGNAPIHLPWLYTRNRIAYEAQPFRNLVLATGLDIRYHSAYYADGYSPVLGQFFYQSTDKIAIRPDISYYMNFRVRSFTSFVRFENLNTATLQYGFGFKKSNLAAPTYPMPSLVFRLGIFWNFVN